MPDRSEATYSPTIRSMSGSPACSSITLMMALPTMTPSASREASPACSGDEMPNPRPRGRSVWERTCAMNASTPSARLPRAPVTPVRETQ